MSKSPKTKRARQAGQSLTRTKSQSSKWKDPLGSDWRPGAPSKYKPEFCEEIIIHCRKGKSFERFASKIGVHIDTLHEWAEVHKEFGVAKKRAKQEALLYWMNLGEKSIKGIRLGPKGQTRAINWPLWIFWMKARFGWNDQPAESDDAGDVDFDFE
jgi:hypothetical protein